MFLAASYPCLSSTLILISISLRFAFASVGHGRQSRTTMGGIIFLSALVVFIQTSFAFKIPVIFHVPLFVLFLL